MTMSADYVRPVSRFLADGDLDGLHKAAEQSLHAIWGEIRALRQQEEAIEKLIKLYPKKGRPGAAGQIGGVARIVDDDTLRSDAAVQRRDVDARKLAELAARNRSEAVRKVALDIARNGGKPVISVDDIRAILESRGIDLNVTSWASVIATVLYHMDDQFRKVGENKFEYIGDRTQK